MKVFPRLSPTSWLTTKTVFSQIFALLLFAIQAPVLGPKAFGLISIVMVFVGFCENVPGEAAAEALISVREIDERHFSTMTTANVLLSVAIGIVVFVGAGRIAGWFGEPELAAILRWMSVLPAISLASSPVTCAAGWPEASPAKKPMNDNPNKDHRVKARRVHNFIAQVLCQAALRVNPAAI